MLNILEPYTSTAQNPIKFLALTNQKQVGL